jgi:uncharacterized protein (TIGR02099 family)
VARLFGGFMGLALDALLALIVVFCAALLILRFFVLPEIDSYRGRIVQLLEQQIGQPVEISRLAAGWDGWNPRLDVDDLRVLERPSGTVLLALPHVRLTIAWSSLLFVDLRFKELVVERPQFAVRRDASGMVHVAGLTIDPAQSSEDPAPANWLLRQRRILIHDAAITWNDEQRGARELALEHVEFRLESRFDHHRFGLTGAPPAAVAAPLDFRGDVVVPSLSDWRASSGRLYARLDYADVAAWREWLPLPVAITSGKGALRLWFDYTNGEARELVADVVLADVQARLAAALPELMLVRLVGRVGWRGDEAQSEYFTQQLSFTAPGGLRVDPTDFRLTLHEAAKGRAPDGQIEFNNLQLGPLGQVAAALPLPETWRNDLARYAPRGTLQQGQLRWQGEARAPSSFAAKGRFVDLGLAAQEHFPGIAGLSGSFEATQQGGTLRLQSRGVGFALPRIFAEPLALDSVQGRFGWTREAGEYAITIDQLAFANAHAAGSASGSYRTSGDGPGVIDLTAQLTRADVAQVHRYIPLVFAPAVRDWLGRSLVSGNATESRLRLAGNLADFPFADGKKGQFLVTSRGHGMTFDFAEEWPAFSDVDADLRIEGARMSVDAKRGHFLTVALTRATAGIADLRAPAPVLRIEGEAAGPTADFLRFVAESPVADWIDHFTDGAEANGAGKLTVKLELPLGKPETNKVAGEYTFSGNRIKLAADVPAITQLNGKIAFTNHELHAPQLNGEILGGPVRISVASGDGQLRVSGQGTVDLGQLRVAYPRQSAARRVSGTTAWQLAINTRAGVSTWVLESNLKGAVIDFPAPVGKAAAETVPLQIERRANESGRDTLAMRYGAIGRLVLQRKLTSSGATTERALLALGGAQGDPEHAGLWVRGSLEALNVDAWLALRQERDATGLGEDLPLNGVDLGVGTLDVFGRRFNDLHVAANRGLNGWQMDLRGRELAGTARWQSAEPGHPNGVISARLQRLATPSSSPTQETPGEEVSSRTEAASTANPWPEIDIVSDSFQMRERDLGKLELTAQPRGADWHIQRLQLHSDDGTLAAEGWWRAAGRVQQTRLDATLDIRDAGKYLARFGLPDALRGAPTKVKGELAWAGSPQAFDYPTLSGGFRIDAGSGQFIKLDPGPAKLLGILSLQSLRRRLSFDYQDLFGEGFAFDEITGDVRIQNGVMKSDNLRIVGPAASVMISGETDLAHETQQLKLHVQPTLSGSLSVGAAALLLANPIIGAAVGAGTLLAQKIMQDPFEKMFSNDYVVTGTWSDPTIERKGQPPATGSAQPNAGDGGAR